MIEALISSKTRVKLLLKFFLNSNTSSYLRGLESEFGESSNSIRLELNRFEKAGMLESYTKGNKKLFKANTDHPLFSEIHNIVLKHIGFDRIIEDVVHRLGKLEEVFVVGDFAQGKNAPIIDLIFIGEVDKLYLLRLTEKVEKIIKRKIRYVIYSSEEKVNNSWGTIEETPLLLWKSKDQIR